VGESTGVNHSARGALQRHVLHGSNQDGLIPRLHRRLCIRRGQRDVKRGEGSMSLPRSEAQKALGWSAKVGHRRASRPSTGRLETGRPMTQ
jgi:hypothetical protein